MSAKNSRPAYRRGASGHSRTWRVLCCSSRPMPAPISTVRKLSSTGDTCAVPFRNTAARQGTRMELTPNAANYVSLTPLSFLTRAARVFPHKTAVIHGENRYSYAQLLERCLRLASGLSKLGVSHGDTVAVLAPNVPAML